MFGQKKKIKEIKRLITLPPNKNKEYISLYSIYHYLNSDFLKPIIKKYENIFYSVLKNNLKNLKGIDIIEYDYNNFTFKTLYPNDIATQVLYQSIYIPIDECPEWFQDTLRILRKNELTKPKIDLTLIEEEISDIPKEAIHKKQTFFDR